MKRASPMNSASDERNKDKKEFTCKICSLVIPAREKKNHLSSKKHRLALKEANLNSLYDKILIVSDIPSTMSPRFVYSHFEQFGPIENFDVKKNWFSCTIIIKFCDMKIKQKILSRSFFEKNNEMWKINTMKSAKMVGEERKSIFKNDHINFMESASKLADVSSQINLLEKTFEEDNTSKGVKLHICDQIWRALSYFYPNCMVYAFGSSKNGFGMKFCDLDIFIDVKVPFCKQQKDDRNKNARGYKSSTVIPSELKILQTVNNSIRRNMHMDIREVIVIRNCTVPIIKFVHLESYVSCDINISNGNGVKNSALLKWYSNYDERVRPLILTFCYWFKYKKFEGVLLSSYAQYMLVIFFLQNCSPIILPPVQDVLEWLGSLMPYEDIKLKNLEEVPKSENKECQGELLTKLFDFYAKFSFEDTIICPLTAKAQNLASFKTNDPDASHFNKPMKIQDPFELERNIASSINSKFVSIFQYNLKLSHDELKLKQGSGGGNLTKLFIKEKFEMPPSVDLNTSFILRKPKRFNKMPTDVWKSKMCSLIFFTLKDVLLMNCIILDINSMLLDDKKRESVLEVSRNNESENGSINNEFSKRMKVSHLCDNGIATLSVEDSKTSECQTTQSSNMLEDDNMEVDVKGENEQELLAKTDGLKEHHVTDESSNSSSSLAKELPETNSDNPKCNFPLTLQCKAFCNTWSSRKKKIPNIGKNDPSDKISLRIAVSKLLKSKQEGSEKLILEFMLQVKDTTPSSSKEIIVEFKNSDKKFKLFDFSYFFQTFLDVIANEVDLEKI